MGIEIFKKHLREKRAVKISTCDIKDIEQISKVIKASQTAKASAIEIRADKNIFKIAKQNSKLPIFISSIHPFEILESLKWGVDGILIGNYIESYKNGKTFSADEIYDIVLETLGLINKYETYVSVSIPSCIDLEQQQKLTRKLEILGVDLIQIEGIEKKEFPKKRTVEYLTSVDNAINSTFELNKFSILPILSYADFDENTSQQAFNSGASAVGVCNLNNKNEGELITNIMSIVGSISHRNSINREIVRTSRELFI